MTELRICATIHEFSLSLLVPRIKDTILETVTAHNGIFLPPSRFVSTVYFNSNYIIQTKNFFFLLSACTIFFNYFLSVRRLSEGECVYRRLLYVMKKTTCQYIFVFVSYLKIRKLEKTVLYKVQ
jgi:hypothetical protein